jgi:hypothetical protein
MPIHDLTQPVSRHVGVDLRGGDIGVAEHDLDATQIGSSFHQVCRETVPDHVRRERPGNSGPTPVTAE